VVDCLMKTTHFIPYTKIITSKGTTKLLFNHVFRYHGHSKDIIFNHEP
jgi:hypothetical protein